MNAVEQWIRLNTGFPFAVIGLFLVIGGISHASVHMQHSSRTIAEMIVPVSSGFSLLYASYRVSKNKMTVGEAFHMLVIVFSLITIALSISVFNIALDVWTNEPIDDPVYGLLVSSGVGAAVGAPLGFFYVNFQKSHKKLGTEYKKSRTLNRQLSVMHRVLRHNLRNELTVLGGATEMLKHDPSPENVDEYIPLLDKHVKQLYSITEKAQLLERTLGPSKASKVDITTIAMESVATFRTEYSSVDFKLSTPATAPTNVHPLFQQAIEELLENAITHNSRTDLEIEVSVATEFNKNDLTRVMISDTGVGIPNVEIEALWQPEEKPLSHGAGLGLSFVYSIVNQSHGKIQFKENTPSGTIVIIDLPSLSSEEIESENRSHLIDEVVHAAKSIMPDF
ncbi:sensor histidine kinase [Haladaptatus sp. CMSO5]|uniref:sensor histidine kinase n=1 Tax=Haladaptatus sp. CMSO5 TaxID=3120514 RepID=UPI002FCE46FA